MYKIIQNINDHDKYRFHYFSEVFLHKYDKNCPNPNLQIRRCIHSFNILQSGRNYSSNNLQLIRNT